MAGRRRAALLRIVLVGAVLAGGSIGAHRAARAQAQAAPGPAEVRVLATNRTATMARELNDAAAEGFRFDAVMGGETAIGGNETVVIVSRRPGAATRYQYRLLAANRTSTMQRELQEAADAGFAYRGQTVFSTTFGGKEVIVILELDPERPEGKVWEYQLLATTRTSTMQRELQAAADQGWEVVGLTVADTTVRGKELVTIMRRRR
jgi:hypothetical protein